MLPGLLQPQSWTSTQMVPLSSGTDLAKIAKPKKQNQKPLRQNPTSDPTRQLSETLTLNPELRKLNSQTLNRGEGL